MNCFQLIRSVLDEVYSEIPGTDDQKDDAIRKALGQLSDAYGKLLTHGCLDYSDPVSRFAYLYRYTTAHANVVYSLLLNCPEAGAYFERDRLRLAAIGGGPGSDFLGALKFCESRCLSPELKCLLLDRDPTWGESWQDVDEKIASKLKLTAIFQPFDVTNPTSYQVYQKYLASDVFTLIYFMSEVYASRKEAAAYFDVLFSKAKSGSLFIFVDNNDSRFFGWFDDLAKKHGVRIIKEGKEVYQMPFSEEKSDLGTYYKKFEPPKLKAKIAYRIGVKE